MIQQKVNVKEIHGAKASRNGPEISHLLFADDSLLFTRATRQECIKVVDILNKYEAASGQKINYEKSEVSFSKGVSCLQKESLTGILQMREVDKYQKYLGIPTVHGRLKQALFRDLLDRVGKKLGGWKEKMLSRAGKEVLIKAVIQALPTYLMGVYKIPATIIKSIHSAMARFWWGSKGTERKMHWLSWEKMCKPKCMGGMGFKDLSVFNDALLGRQIWRLIHLKQSLLSRVLRAKYYPEGDVLNARLSYSTSYSWRSIWSAKSLVKEGIIWRVGDGRDINIWSEPWIGDGQGRYIASPRVEGLNVVHDLIDEETHEWNVECIERHFEVRDEQYIMAVPLSSREVKDEVTWALSKDGHYSVKTAYMLGKGGNLDDFHRAWLVLWGLDVAPKVRHFLWRYCTTSLPTRATLWARHLLDDGSCPWCPGLVESQQHAIFGCERITRLWAEHGCGDLVGDEGEEEGCAMLERWSKLDKKMVQRGCYLAWNIWFERNRFVFGESCCPLAVLSQRVCRQVDEFKEYHTRIYGLPSRSRSTSSCKWQAPPSSTIKINTDAYLGVDGWVSVAAVARNSAGEVLFASVRKQKARWSADIAKCKAILLAVRCARSHGISDVIVESDALVAVTRLTKGSLFLSDLDSVLGDVIFLSKSLNSIYFSHVRRDGNTVAHNLTRVVPFGVEQCWVNHCPREVAPYVLMDVLSLD